MQRKVGVISMALFASQLLVIVHQAYSLKCQDDKTVLSKLEDGDSFYCQAVPSIELGEGYTVTEFGAHKFHNEAQSWNQARKTCIDEGAHLAIINSVGELTMMKVTINEESKNIVGTNRTDLYWLGGQDHFQEGEWTTVLGDTLNSTGFSKFIPDTCESKWGAQPDNGKNDEEKGPQNCLALVPKCDALDDNWCIEKYAFFCEKPIC